MKSFEPFEANQIKRYIYELSDKHQMNPNHIMMALRYAISGSKVGAGVGETMQVLGKQTVLERLSKI